MLFFLHWFLTAFHIVLMLYNVFGGFFRRWWVLHWLTIHLTLFSWLGLGLWYGWGYCVLTDWHWKIREQIGDIPRYGSFLAYLFFDLLGLPPFPETYVDLIAIAGLTIGFLQAEWNLLCWLRKKRYADRKKL
jgi:hypothetical protein